MKGKLPKSYQVWKRAVAECAKLVSDLDRGKIDNKRVLPVLFDLREATYRFSHDFEQALPMPKRNRKGKEGKV